MPRGASPASGGWWDQSPSTPEGEADDEAIRELAFVNAAEDVLGLDFDDDESFGPALPFPHAKVQVLGLGLAYLN